MHWRVDQGHLFRLELAPPRSIRSRAAVLGRGALAAHSKKARSRRCRHAGAAGSAIADSSDHAGSLLANSSLASKRTRWPAASLAARQSAASGAEVPWSLGRGGVRGAGQFSVGAEANEVTELRERRQRGQWYYAQ